MRAGEVNAEVTLRVGQRLIGEWSRPQGAQELLVEVAEGDGECELAPLDHS